MPCPETPARAALFDLDGTLLDTYGLICESFRHATRAVLGRALPDGVLMAKVGIPLAEQVRDFSDDPAVQARLVTTYRTYNEEVHDRLVRAFPGVPELLGHLAARGVPCAVVTSKRRALAERGLEVCGLAGYLSFVVGSDDRTRPKPDPEPVLLACARLGLEPSVCAYVGDSPFDMRAGNAAGCATVGAAWGMFDEETLLAERPTCLARDPREAGRVLGAW